MAGHSPVRPSIVVIRNTSLRPTATATFCFTPEDRGQWPHYTAVPKHPEEFAEFCATMVRRYAPGRADALQPVCAAG